MAFESTVREGVLRVEAAGARWLSSDPDGGFRDADAAYNVSVPTGWDRTDLDAYAAERRDRAGFGTPGPTLFTGVEMQHLCGARAGSVVAYATAGISNPAALPMAPDGRDDRTGESEETVESDDEDDRPAGTVNLLVGTTRALDDGTLASLYGVVVEAKAATLLAETGFPGTTTDAAVVGTLPAGEPAAFAGSGTDVGDAARACVREALRGSLRSRYAEQSLPASVDDAEHGTATTRRATTFDP
ncbi:adenosylcobinamide amidohydrolase [Halolamina sp. C58]|uniref:adenosylcobinamide amidohydrolase n=1 Tax=Halolamina sp. C58 TaxID=3421640 RepID=UPI003EBEC3AD